MSNELTENQKRIYNLYLSVFRKKQNKPFSPRKDFSGFVEESPELFKYLVLLDNLFTRCDYINEQLYFESPYNIYKDTKSFYLDYYITPKAMKIYKIYMGDLQMKDPDHSEQILFMVESLKYIQSFCSETKIKVSNYLDFKEAVSYNWCVHLLKNKISLYAILGFTQIGINVLEKIINLPADEKELFIGKTNEEIYQYWSWFKNSIVAKKLMKKGLERLTM